MKKALMIVAMVAVIAIAGAASAYNLVLASTTGGLTDDSAWNPDGGVGGYKFTVNETIIVTELGKYGWRDPGGVLKGLDSSVHIWPDVGDIVYGGAPLISGEVLGGTALASDGGLGEVAWVDIPDVELAPGSYRIAADIPAGSPDPPDDDQYMHSLPVGSASFSDPAVTYTSQSGVYYGGEDVYPTITYTVLEQYYGPNMKFRLPGEEPPIPEPAGLGLIGLALLAARRRRK